MKKKSITLLVSCIIFLAIFPFSSLKAIQMMEPQGLSSSEEEINDMDPNLEEVIKETLSIIDRELTTSDLANLTVLKAENKNIQHLSGLEHAVNLTAIDVSNNQITDLLPISNLQSLEEIDVSNNQISSISVIVTLPSLKKLDITNNPLSEDARSSITSLLEKNIEVNYQLPSDLGWVNRDHQVYYYNDIGEYATGWKK